MRRATGLIGRPERIDTRTLACGDELQNLKTVARIRNVAVVFSPSTQFVRTTDLQSGNIRPVDELLASSVQPPDFLFLALVLRSQPWGVGTERAKPTPFNPERARLRDGREFGPEMGRRRAAGVNRFSRARRRERDFARRQLVANPCESSG